MPPVEDPDPWADLFNGKDLTGWKTHPDDPGDWKVENSILVGRTSNAATCLRHEAITKTFTSSWK